MHRSLHVAAKVVLAIVWLLAVGFLAAFAEGYIPTTLRQVLLAVFVLGPLLLFGEAVIEFVLHVISYGVGRAVLPILTFGRLRAETLSEYFSFPWYGLVRLPGGRYVLSHDATAIFGLVALALTVVAGYLAFT